ncbi:MAG: hypothetical protein Ct9H300mP31_00720 [Acidimicrobiaceae bacterium]|nr:MAG: hypothetical protein Ct9H300mP31_00720 [Acidimicrobiaceae bacterium]
MNLVGPQVAEAAREASIACYLRGAEWAAQRGIVIADTNFEFGMVNGPWCWPTRCLPRTRPASGPPRCGPRG